MLVCTLVGTFTALFCMWHYIILWAVLISCIVFLCNFDLMQLENLHHFLNLRDNFWFNVICMTLFVLT